MKKILDKNNLISFLSGLSEDINNCHESYKIIDVISKNIKNYDFIEKIEVYIYDNTTSSLKDVSKSWIKLEQKGNELLYEAFEKLESNNFIVNGIKYTKDTEFNFLYNEKNSAILLLNKGTSKLGVIKFSVKFGERQDIDLLILIKNYIAIAISSLFLSGKMQDSIEFYSAMRNIAKIIENQYDPTYVIPLVGEVIDRFIPDHLIYVFNCENGKYNLAWPSACKENIIHSALNELSLKKPYALLNEGHLGIFGLISENTIIGAVVAYSNFEKLTNLQVDYLLQLTQQAGITLQRAYVYSEILQHATLDALTGLNNRRQFEVRLNQEIATARRKNMDLCCIMLDIDHFKRVNDTYGHLCGDLVLKNIANSIQKELREYDIASRYGGEEFIILLPMTSIEEAIFVAQRLRKAVEETKIDISSIKLKNIKEINVTISVGVSDYDVTKDSAQSFYQKADTALYEAKKTGRNRVIALKSDESSS